MSVGSGNCNTKTSEAGSDGKCYAFCPAGWSAIDHGPICAKRCPQGFASSGDLSCVRPAFAREIKPMIQCEPGADRHFDKCLLDCPLGSTKKFNLCVPDCPEGFVNTSSGMSCQAEFVKRTAIAREACYANETRIGGRICLSPCPVNTIPDAINSELCYSVLPDQFKNLFWAGSGSLVSKIIFARNQVSATCPPQFESLNGMCFANCPANSQAIGTECVASCPSDFRSSNGAACTRPTMTRAIKLSFAQSATSDFHAIGIGSMLFLVGSKLVTFL